MNTTKKERTLVLSRGGCPGCPCYYSLQIETLGNPPACALSLRLYGKSHSMGEAPAQKLPDECPLKDGPITLILEKEDGDG